MKPSAKFEKRGQLAIAASSWGLLFEAPSVEPFREVSGVAVVDIRGPLTHHEEWCWDNYDSIKERVAAALDSSCGTVLLKIDSPGGDASGCFEAAREIRKLAGEKGKRILSYVDGMAASAAYALACAGDAIYVPETGFVGSIGCITVVADQTGMDREMGLKFAVVASGKRKADGNPHVPISEEVVAELQSQVDSLADIFFGLVAEARPLSRSQVRGLEAAIFHGQGAVDAGLADGVMPFDSLLAMVASGKATSPERAEENNAMTYEELVAALKKTAEGDDEDAKKAKKALEAMEDGEKEKDEPPPSSKPEPKEKAEGEEKKPDAEGEKKDDEKEKAAASAEAIANQANVELRRLADKQERRIESLEIERELDKRTDLSESAKSWCRKQPIGVVKSYLAEVAKETAARSSTPTQGEPQAGAALLQGEEREQLDAGMGIRKAGSLMPKRQADGTFVMPVVRPSDVRAANAQKGNG